MNNDIKIKTIGQLLDYVETKEKAQELIDYITNLQEELEEEKRIEQESLKTIQELEEKLYNLTHTIFTGRNYNEVLKSEQDYKSRIDKAIKLLKEAGCYDEETKTFCDDIWEELPNLLNVLKGEDYNKVETAYLDDEWIGEDKDVKDKNN